jgi:hypothetical protein
MFIIKIGEKFQIWNTIWKTECRWEIVAVSGLFKTRDAAEKRLEQIRKGEA